jgi:hypothetical protein
MNKYTHKNGVAIERLENGTFVATVTQKPGKVFRSPSGMHWCWDDGGEMTVYARILRAAWYGWAAQSTPTPDPDGLTPNERKALDGAIRDAKDGKAVYLKTERYKKMDRLTQMAGVYASSRESGKVFASYYDPSHPANRYDVLWDAATGERTVPEPVTYTRLVKDWPDGMYVSGSTHRAAVLNGSALYSHGGGAWERSTDLYHKYTRVGDFDPSVLFEGGA